MLAQEKYQTSLGRMCAFCLSALLTVIVVVVAVVFLLVLVVISFAFLRGVGAAGG